MSESSDFQLERYSAKKLEDKWTNHIIESNSNTSSDKAYSISIPPPNVTGNLHLGHALNTTIQDIFIKFYSLKGFEDTETPFGTFNTIKVEREFLPEEEREQIYWFAPDLDFSIVRISNTDGRKSDLLLKSLEFGD